MGDRSLESLLFGKILIPASYALSGRHSLEILTELKRNETLSPEQVADLQWRKLQRLLVHAYQSVPFYRQRFDALGLLPADIHSMDDYARFPVLTRQDLADHLEEICSINVDKSQLLFSSTGGSTGQPVNYYHDARYAYEVASAGIWRAWSWAGIQPGDRHFYIWGGPREAKEARSWRKKVQFATLRRVFVDAFDLSPEKLDWVIAKAQEFRPKLIYGYVSSVVAVAQHFLHRRVRLDGVVAVMTTAERLLPEQRVTLTEAFGSQVFDQYACREVRSVASQCPHGKMHVNTDLNVVEFVPANALAAAPPQRIVLTPLDLYSFPLLRYVNEDFGSADECCGCGLPFPTMKVSIGRVSDNFLLPDGRLVHGEYFTHLVYGTVGIKHFQFRQVAPGLILFKVVWERPDAAEKSRSEINRLIVEAQAYLGADCKIELQEIEQIPLTASGKYRFTLSDVTATHKKTSDSQ